jgi:ATP-dependent helicase YprA (DUF1998 family)
MTIVPPVLDPFEVTDALRERVARAVIAQSAIAHPGLNEWLFHALSGSGPGALIGDPVVEGVPPFPSASESMADLSGRLLHEATVAALDSAGEQRFPRDRRPFRHQLEAWTTLAQSEPRSLLVSSGTGSGKTECFLVPLIDSLARQDAAAGSKHPLVGVQAIMLYPLNALIASQRERLSAWTRPFGGRIRFALYNGLLEQQLRAADYAKAEQEAPEQVHDRAHLWAAPPPILLTNVTMLEYMTIRRQDRPLLERSAGKLRWIIIDEAHSYIGSAAAEIALLLRRMLQAFEVEAKNVRFVATSATIGRDDVEGQARLRRFLSDLAGVSEDQVHVVIGKPDRWLPAGNGPDGPLDVDNPAALNRHPRVKTLAEKLQQPGGLSLKQVQSVLGSSAQAPKLLEALARPVEPQGRPVLPSRVHRFLRAVPGLWSCIDPKCSGSRPDGWPWGAVLHSLTDRCPHCDALVLEIESCRDCGTPYLAAVDQDDRLRPQRLPPDADEFAAASEAENEAAEPDEDASDKPALIPTALNRLIGSGPAKGLSEVWVERRTGQFAERVGEGVKLYATARRHDPFVCPACDAGAQDNSALRPFRFGAPFLIANAAPVMLDGVSGTSSPVGKLPGDGRRLLSFTDSRQGTARFAANIETLGERGYVRGLIYHMVQKAGAPDPAATARLDAELSGLREAVKQSPHLAGALAGMIEQKEKERASAGLGGAVPWNDAVQVLAQDPLVDNWLRREVWSRRDQRFAKANSSEFATFLMLRELARRPARANSLETLGLAQLRIPAIEKAALPPSARGTAITEEQWRDFLYLLVDRVRSSFALNVPSDDIRWLIPRGGRRRNILRPGEPRQQKSDLAWPFVGPGTPMLAVVQMLAEGSGLSLDSACDRAAMNDLLETAWGQLQSLFQTPGGTYSLDFARTEISPVTTAWRCPVTRRVITRRAFGRTPYGIRPSSTLREQPLVVLNFPCMPLTHPSSPQDREALSAWLASNAELAALRFAGIWNNLHDRAALLTPYVRAEEHSAQQDAQRLRDLEKAFTAGEVNLLACSTTMEMGVDIGPVESVLMTNVPPSIANYRQRVGRAGRRGQGFATSLTLARDTAIDRQTFANPSEYLAQELTAPRVSLDSPRIVQRHVNALALARWLASEGGELMKLEAGTFFGLPAAAGAERPDAPPLERFGEWLGKPSTAQLLSRPLAALLGGTALSADHDVLLTAREAFAACAAELVAEWQALQAEAATASEPAAKKSVEFRLKRLVKEQLLATLSDRGVLPGHGFPGHVVPFLATCKAHQVKDRDTLPTRTVDVALREYAPGAEVVIDGLVWTSAGVTLNWQAPATVEGIREVQSLRWHWRCEECGATNTGVARPGSCNLCGSAKLKRMQYLEPAGFRVDWLAEPHSETDRVQWIEPMPSDVSTRGSSWVPLLNPALGRGRTSHDGLVFNHSMGAGKAGYHICLACGRADEDRDRLDGHFSLVPRKQADGGCPGNENGFLVVGPVALGSETRTDVAEFQPVGLAHAGTAWALASALRVALCRRLGIEPSEIGVSVQASTGPLGGATHSLFLYDRASGGAGLSTQLLDDIHGVLRDASEILSCPAAGCTRGCGACVLAADLHGAQDLIDRQPALELVQSMLTELAAPAQDPALTEATLSRPVADAIVAAASPGDMFTVFAHDAFDLADVETKPLLLISSALKKREARLRLALPKQKLEQANAAWRLGLRDAAIRLGAELCTWDPAPHWLAMRQNNGDTSAWRCAESLAAIIGPEWGIGREAPTISGKPINPPALAPLDSQQLLPSPSAAVLELKAGTAVALKDFDKWFAQLLQAELRKIDGWHPGRLQSLVYSDRFVRSPITALLVMRALSGLCQSLAGAPGLPIEIRTSPPNEGRTGYRVWHDYLRENDRDALLERLADQLKLTPSIKQTMEHARRLELVWTGGSRTIIYLDKGIGWFEVEGSPSFRFDESIEAQVRSLLALGNRLVGRQASYIACHIVRSQ